MVVSMNSLARKQLRDVLHQLAPLGEVPGVRDYLLMDRRGTILATKPDSTWSHGSAGACAKDIAQVAEILALSPLPRGDDRVLDFHFKGSLIVTWDLRGAYLLALCGEDANLAIARMTVNVIKEELTKDRRLGSRLGQCADGEPSLLGEQDVASEMCKHVETLKQE